MSRKSSKEKELQLARLNELEDVRRVMATPEGKRFIVRVLSEAGVGSSLWSPSVHQTAILVGRHNLAIWILNELTEACDPAVVVEAYTLAQFVDRLIRDRAKEAESRRRSRDVTGELVDDSEVVRQIEGEEAD